MPYKSKWPPLEIPKCNVLSFLFPPSKPVSTDPLWIDASNPANSLSPAQMLSWVKRFAVGLDRLGVQREQAVMVFTPNHIFVPMVYLGAAGSGRYFSGANPGYTAAEVAYQMRNIDAAVVFIHPALLDTGLAAAQQVGIPRNRIFQFLDTECQPVHGVQDWRAMVASEADGERWHWDPLDGEKALSTIATINFSSGTTGLPKGVCITHRNLIANASQAISNKYRNTKYSPDTGKPGEKWLAFLPLYHAYSQLYTINIAVKMGIPVYVMRAFVLEDFLRFIQEYRITDLQTVPPVLVMMSKRPEARKYDLSSVETVTCGAAPLSGELQNEVSRRFSVRILQGWGMTETTCAGAGTPGQDVDSSGSIGYLLPETEAMLVDDEGNEVLTEGEPGELLVRGPQIMLAYWRNEHATRESKDADGWFKTGDVVVYRGGQMWVVDRKKELIKVNGLQVAPAELEALLLENHDVADAAVVGVTVHGEELPRAYVVLQDPKKAGAEKEQEIVQWAAGKVAKHKKLAGGVMFVDEVPKLPSGKIMRKIMKEWAKRDAKKLEGTIKARL